MSTTEKATDLFEFYYRTIPAAWTNKQRAEAAIKCSLKVVSEMLNAYKGDFYSTKYWDEVEVILNNKKI
jgi:hypothetical protein